MSWRERDYHRATWRSERERFGSLPPRASLTLIVIHAAAFLIALSSGAQAGKGPIPPLAGGRLGAVPLLAHPFAGTHPVALAVTIGAIWILGARLEQRFGVRSLLMLYVVGNLAAGAAFVAYASVFPTTATMPLSMPVGALAAWCGAAWVGLRDEYLLVFGRATSLAKTAAIGGCVVLAAAVILGAEHATGWVVSALTACALGMSARRLVSLLHIARPRLQRVRTRPTHPRRPGTTQTSPQAALPSVDAILEKISRQGIDSLTAEERDRLEAARREMLNRR